MASFDTVGSQPGERSGVRWLKSSWSYGNGDCVEVADLGGGVVGIRDSKNTAGPVLRFTPEEWRAFVGEARGGRFDRDGL